MLLEPPGILPAVPFSKVEQIDYIRSKLSMLDFSAFEINSQLIRVKLLEAIIEVHPLILRFKISIDRA